MIVTVGPDDYLSPDAELRARWRAKQLLKGRAPNEFLVESNILGLCGELAVLAFVRDQLPTGWRALHLADSSATNSDISLVSNEATFGLEVKTTDPERLASHGRIVDEDQIYSTDAQVYVWCLAPRSVRRPTVTILGWSTVDDVRAHWRPPTYTNSRGMGLGSRAPETFQDWQNARIDRLDYDNDADDYEHLQAPTTSARRAVEPIEVASNVMATRPADANGNFAEGAQPLPGFVCAKPLALVTADIRSASDLVSALIGG